MLVETLAMSLCLRAAIVNPYCHFNIEDRESLSVAASGDFYVARCRHHSAFTQHHGSHVVMY